MGGKFDYTNSDRDRYRETESESDRAMVQGLHIDAQLADRYSS